MNPLGGQAAHVAWP